MGLSDVTLSVNFVGSNQLCAHAIMYIDLRIKAVVY